MIVVSVARARGHLRALRPVTFHRAPGGPDRRRCSRADVPRVVPLLLQVWSVAGALGEALADSAVGPG
ncbi:hypothetical protein LQL77_32735, partial [Rhodococcus cerastii]|nr:hypothetical protein [Rhodococcus cerastii]